MKQIIYPPVLFILLITLMSFSANALMSDNLVRAYLMNDATDATGYSYANNTGAVFQTGKNGNAVNFTNLNQYFILNTSQSSYTSNNTISVWIKLVSTITNAGAMYGEMDNVGTYQYSAVVLTDWATGGCGPGLQAPTNVYSANRSNWCYDNTWHNLIIRRWANDTVEVWYDGVLNTTKAVADQTTTSGRARIGVENYGGTYRSYFGSNLMDEFYMWNRSVSNSEIAILSAGTTSAGSFYPFTASTPDSISFLPVNQSPSDITSTNMFNNNLYITSNITATNGSINNNSVRLFYTVNQTGGCWIYTNGSCNNNGYLNTTYFSVSGSIYNFTLYTETDLYPATYNYNETLITTTPHLSYNLTSSNNYMSVNILNVNPNTTFNYLEADFNVTSFTANVSADIYYCNSSYNFNSNPSTSSNCYAFQKVNVNTPKNHTHTIYSSHILLPMPISSGMIGTVGVTSNSTLIFNVPSNQAVYTMDYIPNNSGRDLFKISSNNGNSWSSITGVPDLHIHQFFTGVGLKYYISANGTLPINYTNSSSYFDNYDITLLGITPPNIISPGLDYVTSGPLNITFNPSLSSSTTIIGYNITIYNTDNTLNQIVNYTNVTSFIWNNNLSIGQYLLNVTAIDNYGQTNYDVHTFNRTATLNISAYSNLTGLAISNFSVYSNGVLVGSTNNGTFYYQNLLSSIYSITIDSPAFSLYYSNETITADKKVNYSLLNNNAVLIYFKDENTGLAITQNLSIRFFSDTYGEIFTNYSNNLSSFFVDNLNVSTYQVTISGGSYSPRNYIVTVANRSYQVLNAYLSTSTSNVTFTVTDQDTSNALSNVLCTIYRNIGGVWTPTESRYTDVTGRIVFSYTPGAYYKFYFSLTNYDDYIFYLQPILFSSYDIKMRKTVFINTSFEYGGISLVYAPEFYINNNASTFNFIIQSPNGTLINYGYTATYPGGSVSNSGTNALGSQLSSTINISGANIDDRVRLDYFYRTTIGGYRNFTVYFPIAYTISASNNTMIKNKSADYGLGIYERVLISTVIIIFIIGIGTLVGRPIEAMVLGLFIFGYLAYIGFIPLWSIILSLTVGVFFILWRNS